MMTTTVVRDDDDDDDDDLAVKLSRKCTAKGFLEPIATGAVEQD